MSTYILIRVYGYALMFVGMMIWYLERLLRKKNIINLRVEMNTDTERLQAKINKIVKGILGPLLVWMIFASVYPAIKDIPYVLSQDYEYIEGYTISYDQGKTDTSQHLRTFSIQDGSRVVNVHVYTRRVTAGVYMKIIYLPNTHYGTVLERGDNK